MATKRFLDYLVSERGRQFTFKTICITGISMFSVQYLPNTILITKYCEILQAYKGGFERKVPDKIQRRFEQAVEICKCTNFEKKFLKPFIAYGFDTLHIGTTKSRFGGLIGVPPNYCYDSTQQIEKGEILLRQNDIKWGSEHGQMLQDALVLTEDEQIFGMARSILQIKSHKLLLTSLYAPITLFLSYTLGSRLNQRGNLYGRPLGLRLVLYSILGTLGYGIYSFLTDYTQVYYDTCADKELCDVGPEFMEAGVRFYDKLLRKNIAIRNLTNDNSFTVKGNEQFLWRQKSLPLTIRKSYFELRLEDLKKNLQQSDEGRESTDIA